MSAYTAHVAHVGGLWLPVVKRDGREVWRGTDACKRRDQGQGSARGISSIVARAANDPQRFEAQIDWARRFGRPGEAGLYEWARAVAQSLAVSGAAP